MISISTVRGSNTKCSMSGKDIDKGEKALSLRKPVGQNTANCWISISSIISFSKTMRQLGQESDKYEPGQSVSEHISVRKVSGYRQECPVCHSMVHPNSYNISIQKAGGHGNSVNIWIHFDCAEELAEILNTFYNNEDFQDFIAEAL